MGAVCDDGSVGLEVVEWERSRVADLAQIVTAALPGEQLSEDELLTVCWDDPGVVLAASDATAAASAVVRSFGDLTMGWVRLLVVHPGQRRLGSGRALLAAAEDWCRAQGARQVRVGGSAPWYLWPGIDMNWTAGLCLAETAGYRPEGAELNMSCPTTMRRAAPDGVLVRRTVDDHDAATVLAWAAREWPHWVAELTRGVEQGGAFGAFDEASGAPVGFACHSVIRAAWVGPMATRNPTGEGVAAPRGTGAALLSELCRDLMVAGYPDAEISWVGPVSFYAKVAGARVSRVFRTVVKDLR